MVLVEVSVDPTRDTPARLAAYAKAFGVPDTLLAGSPTTLRRLWTWFGVWYQHVAEGTPPDIDWETGRPYTYDVNHSDDAFVLGRDGAVRSLVTGNADVSGSLPRALSRLLDSTGRHDLAHPGAGSRTPSQLLGALSTVLGEPVTGAT